MTEKAISQRPTSRQELLAQNKKLRSQLRKARQALRVIQNGGTAASSEALRQAHDELRERVKELSALHGTARILQDRSKTIPEAMQAIVALVPPAMQYPQVAAARIILDGEEFTTPGFAPSPWSLWADWTVDGQRGIIEVYYSEEKPSQAQGPFLAEESNLLNTLAEMLRAHLESKQAQDDLYQAYTELETRVEERTAELARANATLQVEIAERQQAQEQSARSLAQGQQHAAETEAVFAAINDAVLIYDTSMNVARVNSCFAATFGFSPLGLNVEDVIERVSCRRLDGHSFRLEDRPTPRALHGEKVAGARFLITRPDGVDMTVETSSAPLRVGDHIVGAVTVWHDTTERERLLAQTQEYAEQLGVANEQLREQAEELEVAMEELSAQNDELRAARLQVETERQRYQELFDFAPGGYLVTDHNGTIREANRAAAQMLNVRADRLVGKPAAVYVAEQDHPTYYARLGELRQAQETVQWEMHMQPREGAPVPTLVDVAPMRDAQGQLAGLRWLLRDITDRKQMEDALRESRQKYQALIETTSDFIWEMDPQSRYTYCSPQMEPLWGLGPQDMLGKTPFDLMPPGEQEKASKYFGEIINSQKPFSGLVTSAIVGGGRLIFVETNGVPFFDADGKLAGYRGISRDITERRRIEESLRESEERFSQALRFSPVGINIFRFADGCSVDANDAFLSLIGYSREELIGHSSADLNLFFDPKDRMDWMREVREHGVARNMEIRIRTKSGQAANVLFSLIKIEVNAEVMGLTLAIDITERKRAEEALRESEARFKVIASSTPDHLLVQDRDLRYSLVINPQMGLTEQDMLGKTDHEFLSKEDADKLAQIKRRVLETGASVHLETSLTSPQGEQFFEGTYVPKFNAQDQVDGLIGYFKNVTERKRMEDALRESEERFRSAFDDSAVAMALTAPNLHLLRVNPAYCRLLGFQESELIGHSVLEFTHPDDAAPTHGAIDSVVKGKQPTLRFEKRYIGKDGRLLWVDISSAPVCDAQGNTLYLVTHAQDITERKQAEAALRESEQRFRSVLENSLDAAYRRNLQTDRYDYMSTVFEQITGWSVEEMNSFDINSVLALIHPDDLPVVEKEIERTTTACQAGERAIGSLEYRFRGKDGEYRWLGDHINVLAGDDGCPLYRLGIVRDITERKRREQELAQLNRTLRAHSRSDQALMRATDEAKFMQDVCQIIIEDCGHAMAWIGFAEDDEAKSVRPVAHAGFEEGYLETLRLTWADTERGNGPTGTAIRTGQPSFCRNMLTDHKFAPWRAEALKRGYASSLVLPMSDNGQVFGALTIYFREPDPFTEDEIALLSGLADDLAYGIRMLRLRAAHAQAEEALHASEERYRSLFEAMTEGFALHEIICDEQGQPCDYRFLEINPSFERLTGLRREDVVGKTHSEVLPDDSPLWVQKYGQVALTGQPIHLDNYSPALKRHYEVFAYRPAPRQFAALFMDITERKQMEEALRASEERARDQAVRLQAVLDAAPAIIWTAHDRECRSITGNRSAQELLRVPEGANVSKSGPAPELLAHYRVFNQDVELAPQDMPVQRVAASGQGLSHYPMEIVFDDGSVRSLLGNVTPLLDSAGRPNGAVAAFMDVTERKQIEAERERLLAQLQEQSEQLSTANKQLRERTEEMEVMMEELAAQNDELRAAQQLVGKERQRYQELFDFAPGGYLVTDPHGTIREANRAMVEMLNIRLDRLEGKPMSVFVAEQEQLMFYTQLTRLQQAQETRQWEMHMQPREGAPLPALVDVAPILDAQGQLAGLRWLLRDITELRQTQQRLEQSNAQLQAQTEELEVQTEELQLTTQELLRARDELELRVQERTAELAQANADLRQASVYNRSLIEASLDPLVTIGPDGKITDVNAAAEQITGRARAELVGTDFADYFSEPELARAGYEEVFRAGSVRDYALELVHRDGSAASVLYNASVYRDEAGHVMGVFAAARDITKRKEAEEQLRLQSAALEAAASGIIITDVEGHIQWVNPAFVQMTGYARDEVLGQTTRLFKSGRQSHEDYQQLWKTILSGRVWRGQLVNRRKDGSLYPEEQTIAPVLNAEADITHFVAIKQDITERKRMEEAEQRARRIAETLSAATVALTQSLNLETVLDTLLDYVGRLVSYDSANIMLLEAESRLVVRVTRGYERWTSAGPVRGLTFDVRANPILDELFTTRKSCLVLDARTRPGWEIRPGTEHVRCWLGVPLIASGNVIGIYSLDKTEPGFFTQEHVQLAEMLVGQAAVAVQNAWLFEQVRAGSERLQSLSRRLVEIQESERRYIARELHDEAGQSLTGLIFSLGQLEQETDHAQRVARIGELKRVTTQVLEDLHRLAMDLRPASLDHLGMIPALEQYVRMMGERYSLIAQFKAVGLEGVRLRSDLETALYRIVQEALTNVVRHARAARVDVLLEQRGDRVVVVVEDDGVGFEADSVQSSQSGRLGLLGIRERAEMLGGSLVIESAPGTGTTIVVEVPHANSNSHRG